MPKLNFIRIDYNIIGIYLILGFIYYSLTLNLDSLLGIIFGSILAYMFFVQVTSTKENIKEIILVVIGTTLSYLFFNDIFFLSGVTIGLNLTLFYLYFVQKQNNQDHLDVTNKHELDINLANILNSIILISIVLSSSVEKLRGVNKLAEQDIRLIIPLIVCSVLAYYFLVSGLKTINKLKHNQSNLKYLLATILILVNLFFLVSFFTFKEVGSFLLFGPLLAGLVVYSSEVLKLNYRISIINILIFIALIAYPYQVSGILGISVAFLVSVLLITLLQNKKDSKSMLINHMFIILFVYASAEFRENEGLIPKFNLVNGMQIVYLFIASTIILKFEYILTYIKQVMTHNELASVYAFVITLFTTLIMQLGLKYWGWDLLIGLIITGSLGMVFAQGYLDMKKDKNKELPKHGEFITHLLDNRIYVFLNLFGAILLNMSVKI